LSVFAPKKKTSKEKSSSDPLIYFPFCPNAINGLMQRKSQIHTETRKNFPKWKWIEMAGWLVEWEVGKKREKCSFSDNGFDLF
jgi:hypothetical protein